MPMKSTRTNLWEGQGRDLFAVLVRQFSNDGPDGLLRVVRHQGQIEADQFVVSLGELESSLSRSDFLGDAI